MNDSVNRTICRLCAATNIGAALGQLAHIFVQVGFVAAALTLGVSLVAGYQFVERVMKNSTIKRRLCAGLGLVLASLLLGVLPDSPVREGFTTILLIIVAFIWLHNSDDDINGGIKRLLAQFKLPGTTLGQPVMPLA